MRCILVILLALLATATAHAQSIVTANIHNAPGWQPSTSYTYSAGPPSGHFKRVVNGAGWTPAGGSSGTWNNGSALNAYQLLNTTSPCTSASSGGPSGTGSDIVDGTGGTACHWKYLSAVDYVAFTGWALDNGSIWTTGTNYGYLHVVQVGNNPTSVYQQTTPGCYSTIQPSGTVAADIYSGTPYTGTAAGDGCVWGLVGTFNYTSRANSFPMSELTWDHFSGYISSTTLTVTVAPATVPLAVNQFINTDGITASTQITALGTGTGGTGTYTITSSPTIGSSGSPVTIFSADEYTGIPATNWGSYGAVLWNDREYVSGAYGEAASIATWNHNYRYYDGKNGIAPVPGSGASTANPIYGYPITISAAPGESFKDTFAANPSLALAGYNANYGVAFHGTGVSHALWFLDGQLALSGIQFKADDSTAIGQVPWRAGAWSWMNGNIIEGGTSTDVGKWATDCPVCYYTNNLIIVHGMSGVALDYGGKLHNNTIVCASGTCPVAVGNTWSGFTPHGSVLNGNAIFGFTHLIGGVDYNSGNTQCVAFATVNWACATWQGTNNATDVVSTDGNNYPSTVITNGWNGAADVYVENFATGAPPCGYFTGYGYGIVLGYVAGTCTITNSLSPSAVFISWPGNYKISNTSPLYGVGASFGTINRCGPESALFTSDINAGTWSGCTVTGDTPDIFGTARPQGARYDIGAYELVGAGASLFGGRLWFR